MNQSDQRFRRLCTALDYSFSRFELLRQAVTHRSFGAPNNERFEFVGDSILNYTVAKMLFDHFPKLSEGELSRLRANLVNQSTLAEIARHHRSAGEAAKAWIASAPFSSDQAMVVVASIPVMYGVITTPLPLNPKNTN